MTKCYRCLFEHVNLHVMAIHDCKPKLLPCKECGSTTDISGIDIMRKYPDISVCCIACKASYDLKIIQTWNKANEVKE